MPSTSAIAESPSAACTLGFNGELHEHFSSCQFLGNGYRAFNPVLMRFQGPDSLSPFQEGGINAYAYARIDPVNLADPSGHFAQAIAWGALAAAVGTGLGAVASHIAGDDKAMGVFGAMALGFATASVLAAAAHIVPRSLSPKAFGQQPKASGKELGQGEMRFFQAKDGTHVVQAHGLPGVAHLGGRAVGAETLVPEILRQAGTTPIKRLQMQVCFGADRGINSLGHAVAKGVGAPTMAFVGPLHNAGRRLTYKVGNERYFLPGGGMVTRTGAAPSNPWRQGKPNFPRDVRALRNKKRR
ncbi:RHS repeat-associated core domain-containing protein [Stenotrophomonas sp.]|uniref:RHS repeat-associated core domain-containing protein n=1 Tax=Stenotrophomonas sp. TaxID=69392 RepID=UPI0028B0CFF0|nr:RHS repeat-associated core domain-containing protein [Stenotrophomonas sp.]